MDKNEITQIKIEGQSVGIMGLKTELEEMARSCAEKSDSDIQEELLKRLSKRNYIPDRARKSYSKAFLREFKKFVGQPFEEEIVKGIQIRVLGPGCSRCDMLEQEIMKVLTETNLQADLEHVRDIMEIAKYGVMGTPALIINDEVKSVGKVPSKDKIIEWLKNVST
jgi:small redox-active disulfide protein 2